MGESMNPGVRSMTVTAVVATALMLSACGGSKSDTAASSTTTTSSVTSTTLDPADQAVIDAYRRFWDVYIAASNPMNPMDSRLGEVAIGEELRQVSSSFLARRSQGQVFKGTIDLDPKLLERTETNAKVRDCHDSHIAIYKESNGEQIEPGDGKEQVLATLELVDGTWKVSGIKREATGCAGG